MSTGRFKKMWDRNDLELEATIQHAIDECDKLCPLNISGKDVFYAILAGVDAYIEKRKRKEGIGLQPTAPIVPNAVIVQQMKEQHSNES